MKALLTVGLSAEAILSLRGALEGEGWEVFPVAGWTQVFLRLRERSYRAVICEATLPDGDWRDALDELWLCTDPPPFIVTSRLADARLWGKVLDAGGYDVVSYPFELPELKRLLGRAASRVPAGDSSHPQARVGSQSSFEYAT